MSPTDNPLRAAYEYLRAGKRQEALQILAPILRTDRNNADAWWLTANTLTEPGQVRTALENVLRLRPNHAKARQMLGQLNARFPLPQPEAARAAAPASETYEEPPDAAFAEAFAAPSALRPPGAPAKKAAPPVPLVAEREPGVAAAPPAESAAAHRLKRIAAASGPLPATQVAPPVRAMPPPAARTPSAGLTPTMLIIFAVLGVVIVAGVILLVAAATRGPGGIPMDCLGFPDDRVPVHVIRSDVEYDLNLKGCISRSQPIYDTVDSYVDDAWVFHGEAGAAVTIALTATTLDLDPELALYDPWGRRIAANDDIDWLFNLNARLAVTLPSTGAYTIVVSAYGYGGPYELIME